ncbi:YicC family protein [bacterium 210820-DFI.6.37]|nr:YicC family protein [bacterium 210820-DFI.6.37]
MIKSMTGFGRSEHSDGKRNITVEIKSVNHRYGDISVKMPRRYSFAEEKIKSTVKKTVSRGKVDVSIIVENLTEDDVTVKLNAMVAKQYVDNLEELRKSFDLEGDVTLQFLATLPDVMKAVPDVEDEEEICRAIQIPLEQAVKNLDHMRTVEGQKLSEDLLMRGGLIRDFVKKIEERSPRVTAAYTEKLRERVKELIGNNVTIPEDRILLEAAIFADKCSITEELVRLDSHMLQLKNIIEKSSQPAGKKLDFLVQEMNREANTIGSKANDIEITNLMLEIKSEIEKIREQVQNIE